MPSHKSAAHHGVSFLVKTVSLLLCLCLKWISPPKYTIYKKIMRGDKKFNWWQELGFGSKLLKCDRITQDVNTTSDKEFNHVSLHALQVCVCLCWLTWYIAISHFTFFSKSFLKVSSNLWVASLVDACRFFISHSSDCNYRVNELTHIDHWSQVLIIFLILEKNCECIGCNTFLYFSFSILRSLDFFSYSL